MYIPPPIFDPSNAEFFFEPSSRDASRQVAHWRNSGDGSPFFPIRSEGSPSSAASPPSRCPVAAGKKMPQVPSVSCDSDLPHFSIKVEDGPLLRSLWITSRAECLTLLLREFFLMRKTRGPVALLGARFRGMEKVPSSNLPSPPLMAVLPPREREQTSGQQRRPQQRKRHVSRIDAPRIVPAERDDQHLVVRPELLVHVTAVSKPAL